MKTLLSISLTSIFLFILISSASAQTHWYVDSSATGLKNGKSWIDAWISFSQISGVQPGDTVYISGGARGTSRTYTLSQAWVPKSGSTGHLITYQIGQDAQHNGTAIINVSNGDDWINGPISHVIISGDAGDGLMHFKLNAAGRPIDGSNGTDIRFSYVDAGRRSHTFRFNDATQIELDHCYLYKTDGGDDYVVAFISVIGNGWDVNKIHDNTFYAPRSSCGDGDDGVQGMGNGVSIYRNTFISYETSYTGSQHGDGLQPLSGSYLKVYDNYFQDWPNSAVFGDAYYGNFTHFWIFNNIVAIADAAMNKSCDAVRGIEIGPDGGVFQNLGRYPTFSDVVVANNVISDTGSHAGSITLDNFSDGQNATFTQCSVKNNIVLNSTGIATSRSVATDHNVTLINYTGGDFLRYNPLMTNNDYHLSSSGTHFRDLGVDLSAYFNADKEGTLRPQNQIWDIGPYEYITVNDAHPDSPHNLRVNP